MEDIADTYYAYSVSLKCAIAQLDIKSELDSVIQWVQIMDNSEPHTVESEKETVKTEKGTFFHSTTHSVLEDYIVFQSVLNITQQTPPNGTHTYWCDLYTPSKENNTDINVLFANRATIFDPDFYNSLPPCPRDTAFHLAQSVCINSNITHESTVTIIPNTTSSSNSTNGDSVQTSTIIIAGVVSGTVVVILVGGMCVSILCYLCLRGEKRRGDKQSQHSTHAATVTPTPTATTNSFPEHGSVIVVSENNTDANIPTPVVPQKPSIMLPTHVQTLKMPISARKRAASLLKQLQKPRKSSNKKGTKSPTDLRTTDTDNQQGSPQRKKPYKTLELTTVETPHLYMTRAKSPHNGRSPPLHVLLQNQPCTDSRERLLSATMSNGYVLPGDANDIEQSMYTEIEPHTLDYLALYTVPRQHSPSTSREEQPIYEEPIPN